MARFLIDEDLPKAVAQALSAAGHDARGVRDGGLQGSPDAEIHAFATGNGLVLVTADLGLADPFRYPPEHGTVLVRRCAYQTRRRHPRSVEELRRRSPSSTAMSSPLPSSLSNPIASASVESACSVNWPARDVVRRRKPYPPPPF
jgi:predicted nuclease of predicted toxin-antitoxin system